MGFTIPWWVYLVAGALLMLTVMLPIFAIVCAWAGWPRQRERELEELLDAADDEIERLTATIGCLRTANRIATETIGSNGDERGG